MNAFRRVVVAALLAVWFFPAVSMAKSAPSDPAPLSAPVEQSTSSAAVSESNGAQTESLATREQKASQLQDFKGGGVVVIMGSGALIVVIILLLLLV